MLLTNHIKSIYPLLIIGMMILIVGCVESPTWQDDVVGAWKGYQWLVDGEVSDRSAAQVTFLFNSDSTYAARYAGDAEQGIWYVKENKLYTLAEGQIPKMVEINRIKGDTLVLDMNRVGTAEQLILARMQQ